MTIDTADLLPEINEQTETAPVTREAFLAQSFMEDFFVRFAEAELSEDQLFLISVTQDFDQWLIKMGLLPPDSDTDPITMRGKGVIRQEVRASINRAAEYGKTIWPPFSIQPNVRGVNYEVRLMSKHLEKVPADLAEKTKTYLQHQLGHWVRISKMMHSERVMKHAPAQFMVFVGIERMVDLALKNMVGSLENLNTEMLVAAKDTTQFLAKMPMNAEVKQLRHYNQNEEIQPIEDCDIEKGAA